MKFNLLLYIPALTDTLDMHYGIFIQHHLMDDADIGLDYFEFDRINSENYALDIVDSNEVTKKVRKDCLVEGFTLNSHYSIDLDKGFNRSIHKDEVRQVFICFKNNSKEPIDAFIRVTHNEETKNYKIRDNLVFFRLWLAPELQNDANIAFDVAKVNYSNFEYFCESIKLEINNQWHSILSKKRDLSKAALLEHNEHNEHYERIIIKPQPVSIQPPALEVQAQPKKGSSLSDAAIKPIPVHVQAPPIEAKPETQSIATPPSPSTDSFASLFTQQPYEISTNASRPLPTRPRPLATTQGDPLLNSKRGSNNFKIIAYILLILGVLLILSKLFGS